MGRHCGWLTYATAQTYLERLDRKIFAPELGFSKGKFMIHGVYVPEVVFNLEQEIARLLPLFKKNGCVNLFVSEGACVPAIIAELEKSGQTLTRDAFGHVKLDQVNAGKWVGEQLSKGLNAQKVLVQKSGYFSRSAAPNAFDLHLIQSCADFAVECAFKGMSGLIGHDTTQNNRLACIDFSVVKGARALDVNNPGVKVLFDRINR